MTPFVHLVVYGDAMVNLIALMITNYAVDVVRVNSSAVVLVSVDATVCTVRGPVNDMSMLITSVHEGLKTSRLVTNAYTHNNLVM